MAAYLVDDTRFQAVLSKLLAHVADNLRYGQPAPYNQQLVDTLRLQPAAYLSGASLADVCTHFCQHYAVIIDPEKMYDPHDQDTIDSFYKSGPKYNWCLIIDDEALQSIESSPEPIGPTPPQGADPDDLAYQAEKAFVKLLSKSYMTMKKPIVLAAQSRGGGARGRTTEWNGWLKFSLVDLMRVFTEADSGDDITTYFRGPDKLVEFH
jgi:hypothetical protein